MLERVKDFRYEEIKNWKPIVSLRESYRRENALRNWTLIPLCVVAVVVAYALLSGWIQFKDDANTADAKAMPLLNASQTNSAAKTNPGVVGRNPAVGSRAASNDSPVLASKGSDVSLIGATSNSGRNIQTSAYSEVPTVRIAVCDTELLAMNLMQQWKQKWEDDYTQTLTEDRQNMWNLAADLTTTEVNIVKKVFEQKKRVSEFEIKLDVRELLESYENEIKPICIAVCKEQGYDLIIPKRHALAYSTSLDVTELVRLKIQELDRSNEDLSIRAGSSAATAGNWNLNGLNR